MAKLLTQLPAETHTEFAEIILSETQNVFFLTGQAYQPISSTGCSFPEVYGYIMRHREEYILYIGGTGEIHINGNKKLIAVHPLQEGDRLSIGPHCHMTFHQ